MNTICLAFVLLALPVGFVSAAPLSADSFSCVNFADKLYHEGIEFVESKGLIVGSVPGNNARVNSIGILNAEGTLSSWTATPKPANQVRPLQGMPLHYHPYYRRYSFSCF